MLHNLPLKKKFYAILLLCILIISSMSFISISIVSWSYKKLLYQSIAAYLSYSTAEISSQLKNINTMADLFLADANVQNNLIQLKDTSNQALQTTAYQNLYNILNDYYYNFQRNQLHYMELIQGNFSIRTTTLKNQTLPLKLRQPLSQYALAHGGASFWVTDYSNEYGLFLVRQLRRAKLTDLDHLGILIANIKLDTMIDSGKRLSGLHKDLSCMLFENDNPVFVSSPLSIEIADSINKQLTGDYSVVSAGDHQYFAVKGWIPDFKWDYICVIPYDNIGRSLNVAKSACLIMIGTSIILSFLLCSCLIRSITRHFDNLVTKMKAFGDSKPIPTFTMYNYGARMDELGLLHTQFDCMVLEVEKLIQSNYVNELLKKEAELKALEYQINPHFLYNTLESVNWRAKAINATDISSMMESLGTLLRITLETKEASYTLQKELELIQSYMTIQKIRFEERLDYSISVSPSCFLMCIPKLTIQPLVENAIQYGLEENAEKCSISITSQLKDSVLSIYIKNTGSQFVDCLLEKLRDSKIIPNGLGIGLLNIDKRLKLTFGPEYGLCLYNEGDLAIAGISIPYEEEEVSDAETDYCR